MKIYIDNTKTNWLDVKTHGSDYRIDESINGYTTSYRIVTSNDVIHGSFTHYKDLTMEEKQSVVMDSLKQLNNI